MSSYEYDSYPIHAQGDGEVGRLARKQEGSYELLVFAQAKSQITWVRTVLWTFVKCGSHKTLSWL